MLSRVYNAVKLSYQIALKYKIPLWNGAKFLPNVLPAGFRMDAAFRRVPAQARVSWSRGARLVFRGGRGFRPLSSAIINRKRAFQRIHGDAVKPIFVKRPKPIDTFALVKDIFRTKVRYNRDLAKEEVPNALEFYEIGEPLGYGCNAAVYALRIKRPARAIDEAEPSSSREDTEEEYPLALKLMFNYELDCPHHSDNHIWRSMGAELVPLPGSGRLLEGKMSNFRPLPRTHPNIVRMLTGFVDKMPVLPDAHLRYPEALPSAPFYEMVIAEPRTLFIVMKRYHMTLRDYVITVKRNYWTGRVLLGQLLEGCVFLYEHGIAQRDMKSDNILLQFSGYDEVPHLVISDFGCALATGEWKVKNEEGADLGGNLATRAPEVRSSVPEATEFVDFRLADSWAAGTIAYEIFTKVNPFYAVMKSHLYQESELPPLPAKVPFVVKEVVRGLLKKEPSERLLPHIAANVVTLSLFRFGGNVKAFFEECGLRGVSGLQPTKVISKTLRLGEKAELALDGILCLFAAESIAVRTLKPPVISDAELQLRATFMSRVDRDQLWESVAFFFASEDRHSLNTVARPSEVPNGVVMSPRLRSR